MSKNRKIVILLDNFARSEAEAALNEFTRAGEDSSRVIVAPVTEIVAGQNTEEALRAVETGKWPGGSPHKGSKRAALISGADKSEAIALMRSFKSILPGDADPAFALVTGRGMKWTVKEYLSHIREEHEYMKTANPERDADMKEID